MQSAAANQATIVEALAADAGLARSDPQYYYRAAEAGFNYVDDQCTAYFDYMFFLDRRGTNSSPGLQRLALLPAQSSAIDECIDHEVLQLLRRPLVSRRTPLIL